ncbi:MAG TPA: M4 family metallopeptidase [Candidatus Limnocylindrales bacterium]
MPSDLRRASSRHDSKFNLDYVSYQQYAAPLGVLVQGGQVTVVSRDGKQLLVGGAYYPGLRSAVSPALSAGRALTIAADVRGGLIDLPDAVRQLATRRTSLRLDPTTGRLFYLVATAAPANNMYQRIDAQSGELLAAWSGVDQFTAGEGVGVKGDTKDLKFHGFSTIPFSLTDRPGGIGTAWKLQSPGGADFITYDAQGGNSVTNNPVMSDASSPDNIWQGTNQKAGVDAQYYAALTVEFYNQALGYDWLNDCIEDPAHQTQGFPNKVRSVVHFDFSPGGLPYNNAFWDQELFFMVYGDGGTAARPLSAGQDVVSHELSHAVTQCTNNLEYRMESGALNESFSDIMATAAEFAMEEPNSSNCRLAADQTTCADWLLGEDLARTASGAVIRSLANPGAEGQPSHYDDRSGKTCTSAVSGNDYCYVHTNSGIPNHAFYLMVNGGRNARCSGPTDSQADCDVAVPTTSLDHATKIFFAGFSMLTTDGDMCDARNSTIAAASALWQPASATDIAATILAWQAVGLGDERCDSSSADFNISLSDPTLELSAGDTGSTQLTLVRHDEAGQIDFTVQTPGPATVTPNPPLSNDSSGSVIQVEANNVAADGVYPILVTATGSPSTQYAAASFVIDTTDPTAAVTKVGFVAMSTISAGGALPLNVTWNATDAASGIASVELDHSPTGSGWTAIHGPAASVVSPKQFTTTAGLHQFQVIATDAVGNDVTSAAFLRTLTEFQETQLAYTKTWNTNTVGTPWGTTRYSTKRKATATLIFTGTDVVWIAQRGPKRGVANVFVDGVKTHVDLYSSSLTERRVVFIASGLAPGQHTLTIKVKGTYKRPRVDVDGVLVLAP